jgi:hypothetical protein
LIGNPSTLKSPIIDKSVRPLRDIDKQRTEDWRQKYGAWKRHKKSNPKSSISPPEKPARCITSEALCGFVLFAILASMVYRKILP